MRRIIVAALAATTFTMGANASAATSAGSAAAPRDAVAQLRAQNDVLRERMGQMQLDLLITEVLATRPAPRAVPAMREAALPAAQIVAYRK